MEVQPFESEEVTIKGQDLVAIPKPSVSEIAHFVQLLTTIAQRILQEKKDE